MTYIKDDEVGIWLVQEENQSNNFFICNPFTSVKLGLACYSYTASMLSYCEDAI